MRRTSFAAMNCSVAQTLEVVGEWWSMLVIREAFLGVRRFEEFVDRLGIARNVLTARLQSLVDSGVLERRQYEKRPQRFEYRLTDKGKDLWPILVTLRQWGDRWASGKAGPPVLMGHSSCGEVASARLTCSRCGEQLDPREVWVDLGPGARSPDVLPARIRRR